MSWHMPGQRAHKPPRALADRQATADDHKGLNERQRAYRTCVHCGTPYLTVADADRCEALFEQGK